MEAVDPREVVKAAFRLTELLPPLTFNISVYTIHDEPAGLLGYSYTIEKNNEGNFTVFSEHDEPFTIHSYRDFEIVLKNVVIEIIECYTLNDNVLTQMVLFRCEEPTCLDRRRHATSKIQSEFRKSKGYAAWKYHPTRLQTQGYFNELSFGKRSKLSLLRRKNFVLSFKRSGALKVVNGEIK